MKKNLKVANRLLKHAKIPVTATAKYNIPISREVDIINKWKTLFVADKELAQMRRKYQVLRTETEFFALKSSIEMINENQWRLR